LDGYLADVDHLEEIYSLNKFDFIAFVFLFENTSSFWIDVDQIPVSSFLLETRMLFSEDQFPVVSITA
jgi:hypothetical protein